jgi:hypothetical protein
MKCEYCGIVGAKHTGIFDCVRNLRDKHEECRDRLQALEDLILELYDHQVIRARGMDDHYGYSLIRKLEKFLDLKDNDDDISEDSSRLD